jgi:hypothetical protein
VLDFEVSTFLLGKKVKRFYQVMPKSMPTTISGSMVWEPMVAKGLPCLRVLDIAERLSKEFYHTQSLFLKSYRPIIGMHRRDAALFRPLITDLWFIFSEANPRNEADSRRSMHES